MFLWGFGHQGVSYRARNVEKLAFWPYLAVFTLKCLFWRVLEKKLQEVEFRHRRQCCKVFFQVLADAHISLQYIQENALTPMPNNSCPDRPPHEVGISIGSNWPVDGCKVCAISRNFFDCSIITGMAVSGILVIPFLETKMHFRLVGRN